MCCAPASLGQFWVAKNPPYATTRIKDGLVTEYPHAGALPVGL
jgi:hypothetical protein